MSVKGWQDLKDAGINANLLDLMGDVDKFIRDSPTEIGKWEYPHANVMVMAAYREAHGVR